MSSRKVQLTKCVHTLLCIVFFLPSLFFFFWLSQGQMNKQRRKGTLSKSEKILVYINILFSSFFFSLFFWETKNALKLLKTLMKLLPEEFSFLTISQPINLERVLMSSVCLLRQLQQNLRRTKKKEKKRCIQILLQLYFLIWLQLAHKATLLYQLPKED